MSFYTIQSPGNRNEEVKKYLELKNYLRDRDRAEKMGELTRIDELSKFFKPVSQPIQKLTENIKGLPAAISQAVPSLPAAPVLPAIEGQKGKMEVSGDPELTQYMEKLTTNKLKDLINIKDGVLNIGGQNLIIKKNNIEYDGKTYKRTPELLDLIFSDKPTENSINNEKARDDYEKILIDSGVLFHPNGKGANRKLSQSKKWSSVLKKTYDKIKKKGKGQLLGGDKWSKLQPEEKNFLGRDKWSMLQRDGLGIKKGGNNKTVFLSSDPEALADRLTLLCGSAKAGNTGLKNEAVDICKELIRMKVMTRAQKNRILTDF